MTKLSPDKRDGFFLKCLNTENVKQFPVSQNHVRPCLPLPLDWYSATTAINIRLFEDINWGELVNIQLFVESILSNTINWIS